jgi:predicted amidohydrolase YtcJ
MHGSFMSEQSLERMKKLGLSIDMQPGWLHLDVPALQRVFGRENMRWFFPLRSFVDRGIPVAGGTDHMIGFGKNDAVNPYSPFLNMWACVTRKTTEGTVFYPEERVSREDALRMYTNGPAWMQFAEKDRGSIEVGKYADIVVIDRDILKCPEDEIRAIQPMMTIVNGRIVFEKG